MAESQPTKSTSKSGAKSDKAETTAEPVEPVEAPAEDPQPDPTPKAESVKSTEEVIQFPVSRILSEGVLGHDPAELAGALHGVDADEQLTPDQIQNALDKWRNKRVN